MKFVIINGYLDAGSFCYSDMDCFKKLGGKSDKRGIQLSGVCANTEKYSGVASPLLNKIDEITPLKENGDNERDNIGNDDY